MMPEIISFSNTVISLKQEQASIYSAVDLQSCNLDKLMIEQQIEKKLNETRVSLRI